jgi:hypothetical protein
MKAIELGKATYIENKDRHFGSATGWYALWIEKHGRPLPLMLTENDIQVLHERAINNPEDMPKMKKDSRFISLLKKLGL